MKVYYNTVSKSHATLHLFETLTMITILQNVCISPSDKN